MDIWARIAQLIELQKMNLNFLRNRPTKIVAVGLNYRDHAAELDMQVPSEPVIFLKPASSLIGPGDDIILPGQSSRVDYEAELAIVIGKKAKDVSPDKALEYVEGFTCLNDVTARDLQNKDVQWTRAKSFDTFCPIGPDIVSLAEPNNVSIVSRLNGAVRQQSNTSNFIFRVEELISFISSVMTLHPGDIITTGTPAGIGSLKAGDTIEIEIEGIGILRNNVI